MSDRNAESIKHESGFPGLVTVLDTDKKIKAINLCARLVEAEIAHWFERVSLQYMVSVEERDAKGVAVIMGDPRFWTKRNWKKGE